MKRPSLIVASLLVSIGLVSTPTESQADDPVVTAATNAANDLINALSPSQQKALLFDFDDDEQRHRWSNLPVGMVERMGLRWGDLNDQQQKATMGLLAATLSPAGVQQVIDNMKGDELLKAGSSGRGGRGRAGSRGPSFGEDEYFISILGNPSTTEPWMWQFGGHHLGINATFVQDHITLSPSLTGGQPVDYELDGRKVRQLAVEEDKSFELIGSLNTEQLAAAVLDKHHTDMIWGPGREGAKPKKEGIQVSELNATQQQRLLALIEARIGLLAKPHADQHMEQITAELEDTYFAWFGPTTAGSASSFRIQGPSVLMEYAPQHLGGDSTNHTHAMYRNPTNDYGAAWTSQD